MRTDIIDTLKQSVVDYRKHKITTLNNTPAYLVQYVIKYFDKADRHFERLMDICIRLPESFDVKIHDEYIQLTHCDVPYCLMVGTELNDDAMVESQFVYDLTQKINAQNNLTRK